ncbi:OmpH family outer membrane protein [Flavobacterium jejuense]|uniref:OmpH family outer membrane protein n=1 Tax=Flavobacterium jejuense TaxID=1544455 RepID=A0ABX0IVP5_9FLAO|nr:OmpH family outer membrane protein [Flavobacterium jejuense]NHN27980.1 OmpH family outer membrane protein [Flavobacterium jejuense]
MLKNKWSLLALINSVLIILLTGFILYKFSNSSEKIVYVDNNKLFEEFRMTKEMKKIGEKEFNKKKANLDSLYLEIQREDLSKEIKEIMMKEFVSKRDDFDQFNQSFAIEESEKIWLRIASYSKEFSKENNYKIIVGSNDKRNVLFADESLDVTRKLLEYVNKKYAGL